MRETTLQITAFRTGQGWGSIGGGGGGGRAATPNPRSPKLGVGAIGVGGGGDAGNTMGGRLTREQKKKKQRIINKQINK